MVRPLRTRQASDLDEHRPQSRSYMRPRQERRFLSLK